MTQPSMNKVKKELLDEYGFQLDTMEYHELLMMSVEEVCYMLDRSWLVKLMVTIIRAIKATLYSRK